jgi:hypothetical protein
VLSTPVTVVETSSFIRDARAALSNREKEELVFHLASNPDAGDIVPDTGGARKLRWRAEGRGKRGGVRVIYYYHSESVPLFLLNVFAKNENANLTQAERNQIKVALPILVATYRNSRSR